MEQDIIRNMEDSAEVKLSKPGDASSDKEKLAIGRQLVVATNFLYRDYKAITEGEQRKDGDTDGIRGDLAIECLSEALKLGVRVVAADGGSSVEFLSALEKFKDNGLTLVTSTVAGRAPQRRKAFETATALADGKVIIYTQPEKVSLMRSLVEISEPILKGQADIVVPKRNPELFEESYPLYMRESEIRVNKTYDGLMQRAGLMSTDQSLDWFFGPVVFKNDPGIVSLFLKKYELIDQIKSRIGAKPNPEMNSGDHYFPIIEALFKGLRVQSVEVPFVYPKAQRDNEMSEEKIADFQERRIRDGAAYRLEAIHFLSYLKGDPRSKIKEVSAAQ